MSVFWAELQVTPIHLLCDRLCPADKQDSTICAALIAARQAYSGTCVSLESLAIGDARQIWSDSRIGVLLACFRGPSVGSPNERNLNANFCRYLLYEVVWKDNKADDSLSKIAAFKLYIGSCRTQLQHFARFADEAALLAVFRESLATNFGDLGVARSAMSLSGCQ